MPTQLQLHHKPSYSIYSLVHIPYNLPLGKQEARCYECSVLSTSLASLGGPAGSLARLLLLACQQQK